MVKSTGSGEVRIATVERERERLARGDGKGAKRRKHLGRLAWKFKPMFYDGFLFRVFYWAESGYTRQSRSLAIREKPWRVRRTLSFSLQPSLSLSSSMSLSFLRFAFSSFLFLSPPSTRMLLFSSLVLLPSPLFLYLPRFSFPSIFYVSPFFIKLLV